MAMTSLYKFASWYKRSPQQSMQTGSKCQPRIQLKKSGIIMQKRTVPVVIRTPSFARHSDEYFHSLLLLHLPFSEESSLLHPYSTAKEAFIRQFHLLDTSDFAYESYLHDLHRVAQMTRISLDEI